MKRSRHAQPLTTDQLLSLGMALYADKRTMELRIRGIFARRRSALGARLAALLMTALMGISCFTTACRPVRASAEYGAPAPQDGPSAISFEPLQYGDRTITVEAEVPTVQDAYRAYAIEWARYAQPRIDELIRFFAGDRQLYVDEGLVQEEVEATIQGYEAARAMPQAERDAMYGAGITDRLLDSWIADCRDNLLPGALGPGDPRTKTTAALVYEEDDDCDALHAYAAADDSALNDAIFFVYNGGADDDGRDVSFHVRLRDAGAGGTLYPMQGSPEETALALIRALGLPDMACTEHYAGSQATNDPLETETVHRMRFALAPEGLPVSGYVFNTASSVSVDVGKNGVTNFSIWGNVVDVQPVGEPLALLPFEAVWERFQASAEKLFSTTIGERASGVTITEIRPAMESSAQPDGAVHILPAWDFYGAYTYDEALLNASDPILPPHATQTSCLLCIPAV